MLIKFIIVVLFIAVVVSLSSGLYFLMKDVGNPRKRTLYALGIRVSLAALLVATITYGFVSGKLKSTAPWDKQLHPQNTRQE
ncbi:MAG: twin transmembrane helix small protein [Porticoccaceae bacterium]|nr:twin transmembrane helix small protein [Porticoccaceae bacterium]